MRRNGILASGRGRVMSTFSPYFTSTMGLCSASAWLAVCGSWISCRSDRAIPECDQPLAEITAFDQLSARASILGRDDGVFVVADNSESLRVLLLSGGDSGVRELTLGPDAQVSNPTVLYANDERAYIAGRAGEDLGWLHQLWRVDLATGAASAIELDITDYGYIYGVAESAEEPHRLVVAWSEVLDLTPEQTTGFLEVYDAAGEHQSTTVTPGYILSGPLAWRSSGHVLIRAVEPLWERGMIHQLSMDPTRGAVSLLSVSGMYNDIPSGKLASHVLYADRDDEDLEYDYVVFGVDDAPSAGESSSPPGSSSRAFFAEAWSGIDQAWRLDDEWKDGDHGWVLDVGTQANGFAAAVQLRRDNPDAAPSDLGVYSFDETDLRCRSSVALDHDWVVSGAVAGPNVGVLSAPADGSGGELRVFMWR